MTSNSRRTGIFALAILAISSFAVEVRAQVQNVSNLTDTGIAYPGWQLTDNSKKTSQKGQALQPTAPVVNNQKGQALQPTAPVVDPFRALEDRVHSLQCQLDSMRISNKCNSCNQCSDAGNSGFYLGAAAIFAKPHLKESFQHSQTNFATGTQTLVPFEYDYEATPRAWVGFKSSKGMGLRGTYWIFDADGRTSANTADGINIYGAHAVTVIFPANIFAINPGEQLVNSDSLKTQIVNLYGTYDSNVGGFEMSAGVGLRYARLEQTLNSVVLDPTGAPIRQLSWQRQYDGLGPALTVDAKRRLGCSPFSFFAQGGGSFLFGTKTINRTVLGDQSPQPAAPFLLLDRADEVVGIGEAGFGVEWSRRLFTGHNLRVRGLYEGQLWAEAGAPTLGFLGFEGFGVIVELSR